VSQNNKQGRVQVCASVLKTAHDFRGDHVSGDANDEELAEVGIEDQFGRDARIAAAEDSGVGALLAGKVGQSLFADGGEVRLSSEKALVASDKFIQRLVGRQNMFQGVQCY
jgi:hypothetical protein